MQSQIEHLGSRVGGTQAAQTQARKAQIALQVFGSRVAYGDDRSSHRQMPAPAPGKLLKGYTLGDVAPQQGVITFIHRSFPRGVGVSKEDGYASLFCFGGFLRFWAVVCDDASENIVDMFAIMSMEHLHCRLYGFIALAWNLYGDVAVGHSLRGLRPQPLSRFAALPPCQLPSVPVRYAHLQRKGAVQCYCP